jgi:hypothetical protein
MLATVLLLRTGDRGMGVPVMPRLKQEGLKVPSKNWEKAFTFTIVLLLLILLTTPILSLVIRSFSVTTPASDGGAGERIRFSFNLSKLFINASSPFYVHPLKRLEFLSFAVSSHCVLI